MSKHKCTLEALRNNFFHINDKLCACVRPRVVCNRVPAFILTKHKIMVNKTRAHHHPVKKRSKTAAVYDVASANKNVLLGKTSCLFRLPKETKVENVGRRKSKYPASAKVGETLQTHCKTTKQILTGKSDVKKVAAVIGGWKRNFLVTMSENAGEQLQTHNKTTKQILTGKSDVKKVAAVVGGRKRKFPVTASENTGEPLQKYSRKQIETDKSEDIKAASFHVSYAPDFYKKTIIMYLRKFPSYKLNVKLFIQEFLVTSKISQDLEKQVEIDIGNVILDDEIWEAIRKELMQTIRVCPVAEQPRKEREAGTKPSFGVVKKKATGTNAKDTLDAAVHSSHANSGDSRVSKMGTEGTRAYAKDTLNATVQQSHAYSEKSRVSETGTDATVANGKGTLDDIVHANSEESRVSKPGTKGAGANATDTLTATVQSSHAFSKESLVSETGTYATVANAKGTLDDIVHANSEESRVSKIGTEGVGANAKDTLNATVHSSQTNSGESPVSETESNITDSDAEANDVKDATAYLSPSSRKSQISEIDTDGLDVYICLDTYNTESSALEKGTFLVTSQNLTRSETDTAENVADVKCSASSETNVIYSSKEDELENANKPKNIDTIGDILQDSVGSANTGMGTDVIDFQEGSDAIISTHDKDEFGLMMISPMPSDSKETDTIVTDTETPTDVVVNEKDLVQTPETDFFISLWYPHDFPGLLESDVRGMSDDDKDVHNKSDVIIRTQEMDIPTVLLDSESDTAVRTTTTLASTDPKVVVVYERDLRLAHDAEIFGFEESHGSTKYDDFQGLDTNLNLMAPSQSDAVLNTTTLSVANEIEAYIRKLETKKRDNEESHGYIEYKNNCASSNDLEETKDLDFKPSDPNYKDKMQTFVLQ